ncbi:MAG: protease inhibitor I42 family protein [Methylococcaceae bacterium]|nr:protease inhibitor I42 family protein [Methylococcaceae bacterium]
MSNKLKIIMVVILLMVALFFMQALVGEGMMPIHENENGKTVYLETNDTFEVILESNPTTGHQWEVDQSDPTILKQGESEFIGTQGGVGSVGKQILHFKGITKGQTVLTAIYRRPFEKNIAPLKLFKLNIVVNNP